MCKTIGSTNASGVAAIISSIAEDGLFFDIQNIHAVDNQTAVFYGECLARLRDRQGKCRIAYEFIPALEKSGNIPAFDRRMLRKVLDRLEADHDAILGCNLSAVTLMSDKNWLPVLELIQQHQSLACRLVLDVTETSPFKRPGDTNSRLADARALGCRVAIDDFGAGYLSPLQLFSFDVDIIKLDAGMTWQASRGSGQLKSFRDFVSFASTFAPVVVAEGIGNERDFDNVQIAGVTHVQGWHIAKPTTSI